MMALPRQATAPLLLLRLGEKEDIGDTMMIIKLKTVDNKLIGVYAFSAASIAALNKESKEIAEKICGKRIFNLTTTAFTKKPVSIKYRGLFRLLNKKQLEGISADETDMPKIYYANGYMLNYGAELSQ